MTIKNALKAFALVSAFGLALSACGSDDGDKDGDTGASADLDLISAGTLTVCSDVPYAPFEDFDKDSELGFKGFDVEMIAAVAEQLDVKLVIKDSDFDPLQSGVLLNGRQCDLGVSAMTITDERKKNILFSDGYYDSEQSLLVPADSDIKGIGDLAGKKVGVQKGTTGEAYAKENAPDADAIQYDDDGKLYLALKAGQIDAILQDLPVNIEHQRDPKEPGKYTVVETYDTDETYGFAAKLDNDSLIDAINDALKTLRENGEYDRIYDSYFGTE